MKKLSSRRVLVEKGIYWCSSGYKYAAGIVLDHKMLWLGGKSPTEPRLFDTAAEAGQCYNEFVRERFGEAAVLCRVNREEKLDGISNGKS
jgi:hypothetical protein